MERHAAGPSLQDVIPALVTAWKNLSVYPTGHPARAAALRAAHARLCAFMVASGRLTLGVIKEALAYGDERLESPHVRALAQALHRRGVATLCFEEGVEVGEFEAFLFALGDARDSSTRPPLAEELHTAGVKRISVSSPDYAALATREASPERRDPASLWEAIVQALLKGKQLDAEGSQAKNDETYSARGVAALFTGLAPAGSSADATGSSPDHEAFAAAVATYLSRAKGPVLELAVHQIAELVRALPPQLKERVLSSAVKLLASDEAQSAELDRLVSQISPDEVLYALRRLSIEGTRLSPHALRIVQTLAAVASRTRAERSEAGGKDTEAMVAQLSTLFRAEDIDRYNPDDHQALLEQAAALDLASFAVVIGEEIPDLGERGGSLTAMEIERQLVATLLDIVAAWGEAAENAALPQLKRMFGEALAAGHLDVAIEIVDGVKRAAAEEMMSAEGQACLGEFLTRLAASPQVMGMIGSMRQLSRTTAEQLRELIARLGTAAARSLLDALTAEKEQSRRRRLFNILVSLGPVVVDDARKLLADSRWYVVRNMIALLRAIGDRTSLAEIHRCAHDKELRVRLEAIKTLLAFDPRPPRDLLEKAILDSNARLAEAAVALAGQYGIVEARGPLLRILSPWDVFGARRSLRLKALSALADLADPSVLPQIGHFFRNWRLPLVALEERRAAFRLLAAYSDTDRRPVVERGLKSSDPTIREICQRLSRTQAQTPRRAGAAGFDQTQPPVETR